MLCCGSLAFAQDTSVTSLLNRAYAMIGTDRAGALRLFEEVKRLDPGNVQVRRQLGYLYEGQQENNLALDEFYASEGIQPSDTVKLQIAYLLMKLQRGEECKKICHGLMTSPDPYIAGRAAEMYATFAPPPAEGQPAAPPPPVAPVVVVDQNASRNWTRVYADPYYDTRWDSWFLHGDFWLGYDLTDKRDLSVYGIMSIAKDTRSTSGAAPVIISDNTLILAGGVRYLPPVKGLSLYAQEGVAFSLVHSSAYDDAANDFRTFAVYGYGIYPSYTYHDDLQWKFDPLFDLYSSLGYYQRYKNGIGYLQLRGGGRVAEMKQSVADVFLRANFAFDTQRDFYNNIFEGGAGLRITPNVDWDLHLEFDYFRGTYLNFTDEMQKEREALYDQYYSSFRIFVIYEHTF
jgi:hypothetical protein